VEISSYDQQLEDRLTLIETADAGAVTVADLPVRDFVLAVATLALAIVALLWWAY
jgi:hypothetical protein